MLQETGKIKILKITVNQLCDYKECTENAVYIFFAPEIPNETLVFLCDPHTLAYELMANVQVITTIK